MAVILKHSLRNNSTKIILGGILRRNRQSIFQRPVFYYPESDVTYTSIFDALLTHVPFRINSPNGAALGERHSSNWSISWAPAP